MPGVSVAFETWSRVSGVFAGPEAWGRSAASDEALGKNVLLHPAGLPALIGLICSEGPRFAEPLPIHHFAYRLAAHRAVLIGRVADRDEAVDLVVVRYAEHLHQFVDV